MKIELFLLYMNDLPICCEVDHIALFAEDTSFLNVDTDINHLNIKDVITLYSAERWFSTIK